MAGLRKVRNKNEWKLPYAFSGRSFYVRVRLIEDDSEYDGKYTICCGAVLRVAGTFEEAEKIAYEFTHGYAY